MSQVKAPPPAADPRLRPGLHVLLPGQRPDGQAVLSVLLKRTYDLASDGVCPRAAVDQPLNPGDVPWEDPLISSVRFESDHIPYKLATDVVFNGCAYAPGGEPCAELLAGVRVGEFVKQIYVVGERRAVYQSGKEPSFTEPKPFDSLPLQYERAYGGIDVFSDPKCPFAYGRNPLGQGFVVSNSREAVQGKLLPNIEDPQDRLTPQRFCVGDYLKNWENQPLPAGLGWFPKTWLPRAALAGIMPGDRAVEQELRKTYGMLVPAEHQAAYQKTQIRDMDFRFFNGASSGLVFPYLHGDEKIAVENLTADGFRTFQLPGESPSIAMDIGEGLSAPPVVLHTVMVHLEENKLDLVWRAALDYPGLDWLPNLRKLEIAIQ